MDLSKKSSPKLNKGFSLIEILIAFSILTITVIAAVSLLSSTIRNNDENVLRLQAYQLAQQGLEGIRNVRDSNWTQNLGFQSDNISTWGNANIYPSDRTNTSGEADLIISPIFNASVSSVGTAQGAPWRLDSASTPKSKLYLYEPVDGLLAYTHSETDRETPFRRIIHIEKTFPDIEKIKVNEETQTIDQDLLVVTSTVYYEFRGKEKELSLKTILTDWKEGPL